MRDSRGGYISGSVPVSPDNLPHVPGGSEGQSVKPPTRSAMTPLQPRPDWPEIQVVSTVPAEPHMHIQFGMDTPVPVLGYAVWSDGQMTPMFHWPKHGQIRACRPRETGWGLRVIPPRNDPPTVDAPPEEVSWRD